MKIGFVYTGKVKELDNQWIETQFLMVGIPLIPLQSRFHTGAPGYREGFDIGLYGPSILKGYLGLPFLVVGGLLMLSGYALFNSLVFNLIGFLLFITSLYFLLYYGKSTEQENESRILFQKANGINALPKYLNQMAAISLKNKAIKKLRDTMQNNDFNWIELIKSGKYDEKTLPELFIAMGYHSRNNNDEKFQILYEKLKLEYKNTLHNNVP